MNFLQTKLYLRKKILASLPVKQGQVASFGIETLTVVQGLDRIIHEIWVILLPDSRRELFSFILGEVASERSKVKLAVRKSLDSEPRLLSADLELESANRSPDLSREFSAIGFG